MRTIDHDILKISKTSLSHSVGLQTDMPKERVFFPYISAKAVKKRGMKKP